MANSNAELLTSVNSGIAAVLANLAAGKFMVEWREGGVHVKKANPHELLAELRRLKSELEPSTVTRSASVGSFRGAY